MGSVLDTIFLPLRFPQTEKFFKYNMQVGKNVVWGQNQRKGGVDHGFLIFWNIVKAVENSSSSIALRVQVSSFFQNISSSFCSISFKTNIRLGWSCLGV